MQVFSCEMLIITWNLGPARVNPTAGPRSNGKNSLIQYSNINQDVAEVRELLSSAREEFPLRGFSEILQPPQPGDKKMTGPLLWLKDSEKLWLCSILLLSTQEAGRAQKREKYETYGSP